MKNTIKEIQKFIDDKDWKSIEPADIRVLYSETDTETWRDIKINKDFIFKYALNTSYFDKYFDSSAKIVINLREHINVDLDMKVEDWNDYIKLVIALKGLPKVNTSLLAIFLNLWHKNSNYLKALKDENNFQIYKKIITVGVTNNITNSLFDGLSDDDCKEIGYKVLTCNEEKAPKFEKGSEHNFVRFFKDEDEIIKYFAFNNASYLIFAEALKHVESSVYERMALKLIKANSLRIYSGDIFNYYEFNTDAPVSDEFLKKLYANDGYAASSNVTSIISNLTEKQIIDNREMFNMSDIVKRSKLPISTLKPMMPKGNFDISNMRFFREEDILLFPENFDPKTCQELPTTYISKETFKLLNKTWGKRQSYNSALQNFNDIMGNLCSDAFFDYAIITKMSLDDLQYLKEKCDVSNDKFAKITATKRFANKIQGIKEFENLWRICVIMIDNKI